MLHEGLKAFQPHLGLNSHANYKILKKLRKMHATCVVEKMKHTFGDQLHSFCKS